MPDMHVLVIDNDEQQRQIFKLLLDFIDYGATVAPYGQWTSDGLSPQAVIVSEAKEDAETLNEIKAVKSQFDESMPVLLYRSDNEKRELH